MVFNKLKVIYRIISKLIYYFPIYVKVRKVASKNNCINIKPFLFKRWHLGFSYFTGICDNEKVFIKVDSKLHMLENENIFYDNMKDRISSYLLPLYFFAKECDIQVACFAFADGASELSKEIIVENVYILDSILHVLKEIKERSIIHRDIKLDNFILVDGDLKIIDFTFSYGLDHQNKNFKELELNKKFNIDILKMLGERYKPDELIWNDFVSLFNILDEILPDDKLSDEKRKYILFVKNQLVHLSVGGFYKLD